MIYEAKQARDGHLLDGFGAGGADPELRNRLMLFGQFVGDWEIESKWFLPNGLTPTGRGEIHFGWILNGTAIQDVWSGQVDNPPPGFPARGFGTTIRFYDPNIDALRVLWISPAGGTIQDFVTVVVGDEIVLVGRTVDGEHPERWILSEISPRSFQWRSVESYDNEITWQTTQQIVAWKFNPSD